MQQITDTILMVRPSAFGYNEETAKDNKFQNKEGKENTASISESAVKEFDNMVKTLEAEGIQVIVIQDSKDPVKSDAIFPNNWFSTHENGVMITYPMCSPNRRLEKQESIIDTLENELGFAKRYSFDYYEEEDMFLEGTGSMILDRQNRLAYACISKRTEIRIISKFGVLMNYRSVHFHAFDKDGDEIYHTNVMMAIGEELAIVCLESVTDEDERKMLKKSLESTGKKVVPITLDQMHNFAGNMLELRTKNLDRIMVMSLAAKRSLTDSQTQTIEQYSRIVAIDIETIEKYGGGSVRCMMAEIFKSRS